MAIGEWISVHQSHVIALHSLFCLLLSFVLVCVRAHCYCSIISYVAPGTLFESSLAISVMVHISVFYLANWCHIVLYVMLQLQLG